MDKTLYKTEQENLLLSHHQILSGNCFGVCQPARPTRKHVESREVTVKLLE